MKERGNIADTRARTSRHEAEVNAICPSAWRFSAQPLFARRDVEVNQSFCNVLAQLARFMVEDPRAISACLDVLFVAKSLERLLHR